MVQEEAGPGLRLLSLAVADYDPAVWSPGLRCASGWRGRWELAAPDADLRRPSWGRIAIVGWPENLLRGQELVSLRWRCGAAYLMDVVHATHPRS